MLALLALSCASQDRASDLPETWSPPTGPQAEELAAIAQNTRDMLPPEALVVIDETNVSLAESGALERAVKTGQNAPGFSLPDALGNTVALSQLLEEGPVVLTFYRGHW
jgi:hypothetical protein